MWNVRSATYIAARYFFSPKSTHAVNVIAIVAVCGIALVTAAMVCVLSIFNGFEVFTTSQLSSLSSKYKVVRKDGAVFSYSFVTGLPEFSATLAASSTPELRARGLLRYEGNHLLGEIIGIDSTYIRIVPMDDFVFEGEFDIGTPAIPYSVIGIGVGASLNAGAGYMEPLEVTLPKRIGRISTTLPGKGFRTSKMHITGVFRVDQPEDAHTVYIQIDELRKLLQYDGDEVTAVCIGDGSSTEISNLSKALGSDYEIQDRVRQHADIYKVLSIEKWVSFALLIFILLLSLFSVISTLGMLIIEKREDALTLHRLGAGPKLLKGIILTEGWILSISGLVIGLVLGVLLSLGQQHFGWIRLGADSGGVFLLDAYPVRLIWTDLLSISAVILLIGWLSSYVASKVFSR